MSTPQTKCHSCGKKYSEADARRGLTAKLIYRCANCSKEICRECSSRNDPKKCNECANPKPKPAKAENKGEQK